MYVNTRILAGHLTGVQRYLKSILSHFPEDVTTIEPTLPSHGIKGHAWEQLVLPFRLHGRFAVESKQYGAACGEEPSVDGT